MSQPPIKKQKTTEDVATVEDDVKGAPVNSGLKLIYGGKKYAFDPSRIVFAPKPKKTSYTRKVDCAYRLELASGQVREVPIVLQSPKALSRFGFSSYQHDSSAKKRFSIDISFPDEDSAFLATMRAWDARNLEAITEHRKTWFPKRNLSANRETMQLMLGQMVKANVRDDGSLYDPSVRLKVSTTSQDGATIAKLAVFGPTASSSNPETLEAEDITRDSKIRAKFVFESIYLTESKANPVIRAEQVQVLESGESSGKFGFV